MCLWSFTWKCEVRWSNSDWHLYFRYHCLHQTSLVTHTYPSPTPAHVHTICLSDLLTSLHSPDQSGPRIQQKMDTKLQSPKVAWPGVREGKVTILITFLKSLSSFQMLRNWKVLIHQCGGGQGWQVPVTLRQLFIGKNPCKALTATPCLAWFLPINQACVPFWQVARGGCSVVRWRPSRKRGKQTNRDPLHFPSPFRPARGALVVFSFFVSSCHSLVFEQ